MGGLTVGCPLRLGLDIDGVVAEWNTAFAALLTSMHDVSIPTDDPTWPSVWEWPLEYVTPEQQAETWAWIKAHPYWWMTLKRCPHADNAHHALRGWVSEGHQLYFLTTRLYNSQEPSARWLRAFGVDYPAVIMTNCAKGKATAAKALRLDGMIDDSPNNVLALHTAGVPVWLMDAPYNRGEFTWNRRVGSIEQYVEEVRRHVTEPRTRVA